MNAGIAAGYSSGSQAYQFDAAGYLHGMGIVPFGRVANVKIFANINGFDISNCDNSFSGLVRRLYINGARISSNSWGTDDEGAYGVDAQNYDALTRDADPTTPTQEQMLHVFSAGNAGGTQGRPYSVGSPGVGKNVLTVAAAENVRDGNVVDGCGLSAADNADDVAGFSSRGPANDGRAKPDIIAPGTHIMGPASQSANYDGSGICGGPAGSPDRRYYPNGQTWYTWSSGTSHSTPAVAGAAALAYELYGRLIQPGQTSSPAMLRALLLNGTRYMMGVGANDTLPGTGQGWGAVNLGALYTDTVRKTLDQNVIFGESGQIYTATGTITDTTRPFRATLAWTDAAGSPVGNAYVNDLDLSVEVSGTVYRGNVFSGALSVAGGAADARNNVEQVFLPPGVGGSYILTVTARNIAGNGVPMDLGAGNGDADLTDQDFALVLLNGDTLPVGNGAVIPRQLEVNGVNFEEASPANGNGAVDPGERVRLNINLTNQSVAEAHDLVGRLSILSGNATLVTDTSVYSALVVGASGVNLSPYVLDIALTQPCAPVQLAFTATYASGVQNEPAQMATQFFLPIGLQTLGAIQPFTRTHVPILAIPDNNEVGVQSTLVVSGSGSLIDDIDVRIDTLNHTWTRDLVIRLTAPSGKSAQLFYRRGRNATTVGLHDLVLDDQSTRALSTLAGAGPYTGAYLPEQTLSVFKNEPISGTWTLSVQDVDPLSSGALTSWGLNIRSKTAQCAVVVPTAMPTATSTATPTRTPTPSRTPTATRTPLTTVIPTATKTPTATPTKINPSTPAPTATPAPPDVCLPVSIAPRTTIPDKNSVGLCYDIPITQSGTIYGAAVKVSVAHTWVSDLRMQLRSPYSTTVTLMNRPGFPALSVGDSSDLAINAPITFSTRVGSGISADPELMGSILGKIGVICKDDGRCVYRANPDGDTTSSPAGMAAFNGQASAGNWRFCVSDNYQYDVGTLNDVALDLACLPSGTATPAPTSTPAPTAGPNLCAPVSIDLNSDIPDNRAAPTCFALPVTQTGRVNALTLRLGISHTYVSDLKIQLRSPNSTTLTLLNRPGIPATRFGDSSDLRASNEIMFSDGAVVDAEKMGSTLGGTAVICRDDGRCSYVPNPDGDVSATIYSLAGFVGEASAGDWQVCVSDVYPRDVGTLSTVRLDLVCSAAPALAALPQDDATPTVTSDESTATPTPEGELPATATLTVTNAPEDKVDLIATPTIAPDVDLDSLDKPEEPDWLPSVYLPLLIVAKE